MAEMARSLHGCRVVVTRAAAQASALCAALMARGATVVQCPLIEIVPPESWATLDQAIGELPRYDWLLFTSVNGVTFFLRRLTELGLDAAQLAHLRIGAVGPTTAARLKSAGLRVNLLPAEFTAAGLAKALLEQDGIAAKRVLWPVSALAGDELSHTLAAAGIRLDAVVAYENRLPKLRRAEVREAVCYPPADVLLFSSPSAVTNFARFIAPAELSSQTQLVCSGQSTAAAAHAQGLTTHLSVDVRRPDEFAQWLGEQWSSGRIRRITQGSSGAT